MEDPRVTVKGWYRDNGEVYCGLILEFLDRVSCVMLDGNRQVLKVGLIKDIKILSTDKAYNDKLKEVKKALDEKAKALEVTIDEKVEVKE